MTAPRKTSSRKRVRLGHLYADDLTFVGALDASVDLARAGDGGFVVTPNVDHVVMAEKDDTLRAAYDDAALSLVDGMPLLWMARAMGHALPEKISGSDLCAPLAKRAANEGLSLFLLGGKEGVAERAADTLMAESPELSIAGTYSPPLGFERDSTQLQATLDVVNAASPNFVLVALGCPKQERFMHEHWRALAPAVLFGIGATLDFLAGEAQRAPTWMSRAGLEWLYRLQQEPKRMAGRYLLRDPYIAMVFARMMRMPRASRAYWHP